MKMPRINPVAQKELIEFLASYGLDASEIRVDNWNSIGYDHVQTGWQSWPKGFDIDKLRELHRKAYADYE